MKKVLTPAIAAILLASCSSNYHKTQSGLLYKIVSKGNNPQVKKGEFLKINYVQKVGDSVVVSSYESGLPAYAKVDSIGPVYSLLEVLPFLHKGDSVVIVELGDSLEKKGMLPPYMKHTQKRQWSMKVENVFENDDAMRKDQQALMQQYQAKQKAVFENYMTGKKDKLQKTPGGVYVDIKEPGKGPAADSGKMVSVKYKGKFMPSEKVFETNMDDPNKQPIQFPLGMGGVIPGWDEALKLFHQGGKGTLYIPYQMAYNDQPGPGGLPYQNLIFDIEILDVRTPPSMQQQRPYQPQQSPGNVDTTRRKK